MITIRLPWSALSLLCLTVAGGPQAQAAAPDVPRYTPLAVERLRELADVYKALLHYSDHGLTSIVTTEKEGVARTTIIPGNLSFTRPNRFRLSYGTTPFELACDGKTILFVFPRGLDYQEDPVPAKVSFESVAGTQAGRKLQALEEGSLHVRILFDLLMADDPVAAILGRVEVLSTDEDREVAGKTHWTLLLDTGKGPHTRRLLIDPHTKFLQRIEAVPRVGVAEHDSQPIVRWDAGTISTAPLPPDTFSPRPKGIAHEITMVDGKPLDRTDLARSRAREAELRGRFVGKPAPNFMLTVLDGEGSTRQVSKADLVGKVVLLDFWATWCGPCLKDLPHLQVLAARYARRDDLVIVALSEDEEPADRDELRTRIEETLTRSGVDLAGRRNSLVALDPTKVVGAAFEIYALPTVVLLDRQGIIRSIQVGMALPDPALPVTGDGVRIDLAKEIELLLAAAR